MIANDTTMNQKPKDEGVRKKRVNVQPSTMTKTHTV